MTTPGHAPVGPAAGERAALERHLAGCPGCVAYVQHMRVLVASLGTVGSGGLSPETREGLMEAFRDWRRA